MNFYSTQLLSCEQRGLLHTEVTILSSVRKLCRGEAFFEEHLWTVARSSAFCIPDADEAEYLARAAALGHGPVPGDRDVVCRTVASVPYAKEFGLLAYALSQRYQGNAAAVCEAMESYAQEVLGASGVWLKMAGGAKAYVLVAAMCRAPPGRRVLEIGTYCGYTAMRMATATPGARITTLELDPIHVLIARKCLAFACLDASVHVLTGHSKDLLPRLANRLGAPDFGTVFMDQRGSCKVSDLCFAERSELIRAGAVVVADNVLKPGAPLLLWHVAKGGASETRVVRLREFAAPSEDWMSLSVWHGLQTAAPPSPEPLRTLKKLEAEAERMCERSMEAGRGVTFHEWTGYAARMRLELAHIGINADTDVRDLEGHLPRLCRPALARRESGLAEP